ncbi:hypothetical protein [Streptomyces sp. UNOC14_S4]|uniref:hypothetical protein n=1 Tax=Streptomyces sp. UNOC14_S4 TaxID=2872340 RepID=UPI001E6544D9|nr:hypothetical protein [Streptomyces sp. UNOC14_S4]MCC3767685.1 hypothetical protein [Streptomyces sp. UNOC14_S4]
MSENVIELVWNSSRSKRGSRLVMLALARRSDETGKAVLSLEEIAELTRLSSRAVSTCLGELTALRELTYRRGVGRSNPNCYYIQLAALGGASQPADPTSEETGSNFPEPTSESEKSEAENRKSLPEKQEVPSSPAPGVNTPYGSINTSQASSPGDRTTKQRTGVTDVPAGAREVVNAMTVTGMVVGWRLTGDEWDRVTALSERWGPERLVEVIARRWDPARPPQSARYLLRIWDDLPTGTPAEALKGNVVPLRREPAWKPFRNPVKTSASAYQNGF